MVSAFDSCTQVGLLFALDSRQLYAGDYVPSCACVLLELLCTLPSLFCGRPYVRTTDPVKHRSATRNISAIYHCHQVKQHNSSFVCTNSTHPQSMVQERVRGAQYDELIDELIAALRERFGAELIIHWEDFNVRNSFRLLDKYVGQVSLHATCLLSVMQPH